MLGNASATTVESSMRMKRPEQAPTKVHQGRDMPGEAMGRRAWVPLSRRPSRSWFAIQGSDAGPGASGRGAPRPFLSVRRQQVATGVDAPASPNGGEVFVKLPAVGALLSFVGGVGAL